MRKNRISEKRVTIAINGAEKAGMKIGEVIIASDNSIILRSTSVVAGVMAESGNSANEFEPSVLDRLCGLA